VLFRSAHDHRNTREIGEPRVLTEFDVAGTRTSAQAPDRENVKARIGETGILCIGCARTRLHPRPGNLILRAVFHLILVGILMKREIHEGVDGVVGYLSLFFRRRQVIFEIASISEALLVPMACSPSRAWAIAVHE